MSESMEKIELIADEIIIDSPAGSLPRPIRVEYGPIGQVNANKRLYPKDVMEAATKAADDKAKKGRMFGFIDHPFFGPGSPKDVAVRYDSVDIEGTRVVLDGALLNNDNGQVIADLIDGGISVHVSPRGFGKSEFVPAKKKKDGEDEDPFNPNGYYKITDYEMTSVDFVMEGANKIQRIKMDTLEKLGISAFAESDMTIDEVADMISSQAKGPQEDVMKTEEESAMAEEPDVVDAGTEEDQSADVSNVIPDIKDIIDSRIKEWIEKEKPGEEDSASTEEDETLAEEDAAPEDEDPVDDTEVEDTPDPEPDEESVGDEQPDDDQEGVAEGDNETEDSVDDDAAEDNVEEEDNPADDADEEESKDMDVKLDPKSIAVINKTGAAEYAREVAAKYPEQIRGIIAEKLGAAESASDAEAMYEASKEWLDGLAGVMPSGSASTEEEEDQKSDGLLPVFDTAQDVIDHYASELGGEDWLLAEKRDVFKTLCGNYLKSEEEKNVINSHTRRGRETIKALADTGLSTHLVIVPQVLPIATRAWDKVIGQELVTVFPIKLPQARVPKLDVVFSQDQNSFTDYLDYQYAGPIAEAADKPKARLSMDYADVVMEKKAVDFRWTLEQDQDFRAMYGLGVQDTLVQYTATRLAIETDLAIVTAMNNAAVAHGNALTFGTAPPSGEDRDTWWNIGWPQYVTTIKQMIRDSCKFEPNFVICGTSAARIWETSNAMQQGTTFPAGFREADYGISFLGYTKGDMLRVYTTPQLPTNRMIFGVRTGRFENSGVVFAPYIPSYLTDTVTYPRSNEYEKAMGTRFGMVRVHDDYYGYIDVEIGSAGTFLF